MISKQIVTSAPLAATKPAPKRTVETNDNGLVRMGAGCRVRTQAAGAVQTADNGKVRMGAGCRVRTQAVGAVQTVDGGKVRMGAGCRIRVLAR